MKYNEKVCADEDNSENRENIFATNFPSPSYL